MKIIKQETEEKTLTNKQLARRRWNAKNKEKQAARMKMYRTLNKESLSIKEKEAYLNNKEYHSKRAKEYRIKNLDKLTAYSRNYYYNNRQKCIIMVQNYNKLHKEIIAAKSKIRSIKKYKENPYHRMCHLLKNRIRDGIKTGGGKKNTNAETLLGCTFEYVRQHLASLFRPGMTWENNTKHGWHIDHKIPCASFDLTDPEQQKKCFHYTNLQPLWWYENLTKHSKLNWTI